MHTALAALETGLAGAALLGAAAFVATLLAGRTTLFWPGLRWLTPAALTLLAGAGLWELGARTRPQARGWRRWHAAAWPFLALLPAAALVVAVYADDTSNHFIAGYAATREALLAYAAALFGAAEAGFWLGALAGTRRRGGPAPAALRSALPPVALGVAAAAYLNASVYLQWLPVQSDLRINLAGARDLLRGASPYHDQIPIWADRVHLLPATLVLLFGPLSALPEPAARLGFFLGNQALWLLALGLLVWRLVPRSQRAWWLASGLLFSATYWPWQESIRFGQQDGLIVLLFVLSLTAAAAGRDVEAGVALGLGLIVKPLSIWLPLAYLLHGRWRALLVAGAAAAALAAVTLPLTGPEPWLHFVRVELPAMLPGTVRGTNIPLPSLHARFFVDREALSGGEAAPALGAISAMNTAANLLGLLLFARLGLARRGDPQRRWLLDASLGVVFTLLLAPMAWQHYASWAVIAFLVLALPASWRSLVPLARVATGALAGAAFLLLSLEDGRLVRLMGPLLDRWPAALAFYPAGLLCLAAALATARFGLPATTAARPAEAAPPPARD